MTELRYSNEHRTCTNYVADTATGFYHLKFDAGSPVILRPERSKHLIFFISGKCRIKLKGQYTGDFHAGEMILLKDGDSYEWDVQEQLEIVSMSFDTILNRCDKLQFQMLQPLCSRMEYDFRPLPVLKPVDLFLKLLILCLDSGVNCAHLHVLKHQELFLYFRFFYTKEEVASLFYPVIMESFDFKAFIYENIDKVNSVDQLIQKSNMSRSTFQRKFKKTFNDSAGDWIRKHICQNIVNELALPDTTLKDIIYKYDFSSYSSFNRFCKNNFHCTPTELAANLKKKDDD